jgi:putative DNA primase/helicase
MLPEINRQTCNDICALVGVDSDASLFVTANKRMVIGPDLIIAIMTNFWRKWWRFDAIEKQWYNYDGQIWKPKNVILGDLIKSILQIRPGLADFDLMQADKVHAPSCAKQIKDRLEQHEPIVVCPEQWDQQLNCFNTPAGIINLSTGVLTPPDSDLLLTMVSGYTPLDDKDGANCPHYMKHLKFVSNGQQDLIDYLERLSGYFLTGHTWLEEIYIFWGHGQNGKSKLWEIWARCMGNYWAKANSGQFTVAAANQHKEQDARLMNKRLVISEEVSAGSHGDKWDLSKIKDWSSYQTTITARHMYGKSFEFTPQFKMLFIGNNKPALTSTDFAVERRLRLIPFEWRVPEDQKDELFLDKLVAEAPYILNRMIKAAKWVLENKKIPVPGTVAAASKSYLRSENVCQMFVEDRCEIDAFSHIPMVAFYDALEKWGTAEGLDIPGKKNVTKMVDSMGYLKQDSRTVSGIKLRESTVKAKIIGDKVYEN